MDWFHCNQCFKKSGSKFAVSSCGHISCEACVKSKQCSTCGVACSYLPITDQMKPQEKVFFMDPGKLIQARMENIAQVCPICASCLTSWRRFHRSLREQLSELRRENGELKKQLSELRRENGEMKKQLLELQRETAELKKPLSQRRASVKKNLSFPHVEFLNTLHFFLLCATGFSRTIPNYWVSISLHL
uniref:RING-type domain-containing protein n=1 Tax=Xiphophorus couchianus TaxID=32473 RepID=A0A3B5LRD0_9TELE